MGGFIPKIIPFEGGMGGVSCEKIGKLANLTSLPHAKTNEEKGWGGGGELLIKGEKTNKR